MRSRRPWTQYYKTKVRVINKIQNIKAHVTIGSTRLEQVEQFKYLGCLLNGNGSNRTEIMSRNEQTRTIFKKIKKGLSDTDSNDISKLVLLLRGLCLVWCRSLRTNIYELKRIAS